MKTVSEFISSEVDRQGLRWLNLGVEADVAYNTVLKFKSGQRVVGMPLRTISKVLGVLGYDVVLAVKKKGSDRIKEKLEAA
jgi:hypothetical protein